MSTHEYRRDVYPVAGGWHASVSELNIATYGKTPEAAEAQLEKAVQRRIELREEIRREEELAAEAV